MQQAITPHERRTHHSRDGARRAWCVCGWSGPHRWRQAEADADWREHAAQVRPDPEVRCRTRSHGTPWWQPCPLCWGQLPLPLDLD